MIREPEAASGWPRAGGKDEGGKEGRKEGVRKRWRGGREREGRKSSNSSTVLLLALIRREGREVVVEE